VLVEGDDEEATEGLGDGVLVVAAGAVEPAAEKRARRDGTGAI
jgi:hypothetical protein